MLVVSWKDFMSRSARTWSLIARQWQVYHYKGSNNQQHEAACFSTLQLSCVQWENSVWLRLQWPACSLVACPLSIYSCRCFHKSLTFVDCLPWVCTQPKLFNQSRQEAKQNPFPTDLWCCFTFKIPWSKACKFSFSNDECLHESWAWSRREQKLRNAIIFSSC